MFGKLIAKVKEAIRAAQAPPFDPAQRFGDDLAGRVGWGPASPGGSNFGTHKLVEVSPERVEFRASAGAYVFGGVFMAFGLGAIVAAVAVAIGLLSRQGGAGGGIAAIIMLPLFGLVFGGVGVAFMVLLCRPRVFDRVAGCYWKGRRDPAATGAVEVAGGDASNPYQQPLAPSRSAARAAAAMAPPATDAGEKPRRVALGDIHAVQLLRERCTSKNSSYWSYELNLVLHDGRRVNVIDHGNHSRIVADAARLGAFLGVPVWDAT